MDFLMRGRQQHSVSKLLNVDRKNTYDRGAKKPNYCIGDRVMVHMLHESTVKAAKLARPFFGPFRILNITPTNVEVRLIDKPDEPSILCHLAVSGHVMRNFQMYHGVAIPLTGNGIQTERPPASHQYKLLTNHTLVQWPGLALKCRQRTNPEIVN